MSQERGERARVQGRVVYQLLLTLRDVEPPIWRRLLVPGGTTLKVHHDDIQAAMGWYDAHLREFRIDGVRYGMPDVVDDWDDEPLVDDRRVRLSRVAAEARGFSTSTTSATTGTWTSSWRRCSPPTLRVATQRASMGGVQVRPRTVADRLVTRSCSRFSPTPRIPATASTASGWVDSSIPRSSTRRTSSYIWGSCDRCVVGETKARAPRWAVRCARAGHVRSSWWPARVRQSRWRDLWRRDMLHAAIPWESGADEPVGQGWEQLELPSFRSHGTERAWSRGRFGARVRPECLGRFPCTVADACRRVAAVGGGLAGQGLARHGGFRVQ